MTIINNSYSFIYIHIPKTGGTTIADYFSRYTNYCDLEIGGTNFGEKIAPPYAHRFGLRKHSTAQEIKAIVGSVTWSRYYSFTIVRNPFCRCLSMYKWCKSWEGLPDNFRKIFDEFDSFEDFVLSGIWNKSQGPDSLFRPQIAWLRRHPQSDDIIVDYVGRLESIQEDLKKISSTVLSVKAVVGNQVSHRNKSAGASLSDLRCPDVVNAILEKYQKDFESFGYSENPSKAMEPHV